MWVCAGSAAVPMVVGPRQSGDFIPARSVVEEAFHLLPAADRLVKAVLPERRAFELVLVGQPANGLGADPQLLAQLGGAPELASNPANSDWYAYRERTTDNPVLYADYQDACRCIAAAKVLPRERGTRKQSNPLSRKNKSQK